MWSLMPRAQRGLSLFMHSVSTVARFEFLTPDFRALARLSSFLEAFSQPWMP